MTEEAPKMDAEKARELLLLLHAKVAKLEGSLAATQNAFSVLLAMQPDRAAAIEAVRLELERNVGLALSKTVDDPWLQGVQEAAPHLLPSQRVLAAWPQRPPPSPRRS